MVIWLGWRSWRWLQWGMGIIRRRHNLAELLEHYVSVGVYWSSQSWSWSSHALSPWIKVPLYLFRRGLSSEHSQKAGDELLTKAVCRRISAWKFVEDLAKLQTQIACILQIRKNEAFERHDEGKKADAEIQTLPKVGQSLKDNRVDCWLLQRDDSTILTRIYKPREPLLQ